MGCWGYTCPFASPGPPPQELPSPATRSLREGSGATRPRHLMLFPAGGRRAEKSETPPSTSASRPRGQSTKGGGRRERGRSRRGQSHQGWEEAASAQLGTLPPTATFKDPAEVQAFYPWQAPPYTWRALEPTSQEYSRTEGLLGPPKPAMVRHRRPLGPTPPA